MILLHWLSQKPGAKGTRHAVRSTNAIFAKKLLDGEYFDSLIAFGHSLGTIDANTAERLTSTAFKSVFERKQASHAVFVEWLACDQGRFKAKLRRNWTVLQRIVQRHD